LITPISNTLTHFTIYFFSLFVEYNKKQIKSTKKGVRQSNIFGWWQITLIFSVDWISSGNNATPCIECAINSCISDCDCLLFHDFIPCNSVSIIHFIEFINNRTPLYASTIVPASRTFSPVSSLLTAAVKPTLEKDIPVVDIQSGAIERIYLSN